MGERLSETYAFPEKAESVAGELQQLLQEGSYDELDNPRAFSDQLTTDIRRITNDLHFSVSFSPQRFDAIGSLELGPNPGLYMFAEDAPDTSERPSEGMRGMGGRLETFARTNYSMPHAEVYDGNIGYLEFGIFPPIDLAIPTVDAAMAFLGNVDALILDLRQVSGGVGGFTPYVASYFFDAPDITIFSREYAWADRVTDIKTQDVNGTRRPDLPIWILTGDMTGSAGENLAYSLQQHGKAQVVGRTTRGAANSSTMSQLVDGFVAQIPIARVIHPLSQSNWEGTGVVPDTETPESDALLVARSEALSLMMETTSDARYRQLLEEYKAHVEAELNRKENSSAQNDDVFDDYAGTYGIRSVFVADGVLRFQREGGPAIRLARKKGELFRFDLNPNQRAAAELPDVRFDRDEDGMVYQISLVRPDGSIEQVLARDVE